MKIESVKTYQVEGSKSNWTLVRLQADIGVHGWVKPGTGLPIGEVDR